MRASDFLIDLNDIYCIATPGNSSVQNIGLCTVIQKSKHSFATRLGFCKPINLQQKISMAFVIE